MEALPALILPSSKAPEIPSVVHGFRSVKSIAPVFNFETGDSGKTIHIVGDKDRLFGNRGNTDFFQMFPLFYVKVHRLSGIFQAGVQLLVTPLLQLRIVFLA